MLLVRAWKTMRKYLRSQLHWLLPHLYRLWLKLKRTVNQMCPLSLFPWLLSIYPQLSGEPCTIMSWVWQGGMASEPMSPNCSGTFLGRVNLQVVLRIHRLMAVLYQHCCTICNLCVVFCTIMFICMVLMFMFVHVCMLHVYCSLPPLIGMLLFLSPISSSALQVGWTGMAWEGGVILSS